MPAANCHNREPAWRMNPAKMPVPQVFRTSLPGRAGQGGLGWRSKIYLNGMTNSLT